MHGLLPEDNMPQILHHSPTGEIRELGFQDPGAVSLVVRLRSCQDLRLGDGELGTARHAEFGGKGEVGEHGWPCVVHCMFDFEAVYGRGAEGLDFVVAAWE